MSNNLIKKIKTKNPESDSVEAYDIAASYDGYGNDISQTYLTKSSAESIYQKKGETANRHVKNGNANGFEYYRLVTFPINNASDGASAIVQGRFGGMGKAIVCKIDGVFSNRSPNYKVTDNPEGGAGVLIGAANDNTYERCNFIMFSEANGSSTLWIRTSSFYVFDLSIQCAYGAQDVYSGIAETPTGNLTWALRKDDKDPNYKMSGITDPVKVKEGLPAFFRLDWDGNTSNVTSATVSSRATRDGNNDTITGKYAKKATSSQLPDSSEIEISGIDGDRKGRFSHSSYETIDTNVSTPKAPGSKLLHWISIGNDLYRIEADSLNYAATSSQFSRGETILTTEIHGICIGEGAIPCDGEVSASNGIFMFSGAQPGENSVENGSRSYVSFDNENSRTATMDSEMLTFYKGYSAQYAEGATDGSILDYESLSFSNNSDSTIYGNGYVSLNSAKWNFPDAKKHATGTFALIEDIPTDYISSSTISNYELKEDVTSKYNDLNGKFENYVTLSTAQTVTGDKTFGTITANTAYKSANNAYFQSRHFRGDGDTSAYYHAMEPGYAGHNAWDWYEYGGAYNFWKNTAGKTDTGVLMFGIDGNGNLTMYGNTITANGKVLTMPSDSGTLALQADYENALKGYVTTDSANATYLSKTDASTTYLSKTDASSTYQTKSDATDKYNTLNGKFDSYVTLDTYQKISGNKVFTNILNIQNGSAAGAVVIGAEVNSSNLGENKRKLARVAMPTYENPSLHSAIYSADSTANGANVVEFGGHIGDTTNTSPDMMGFVLASEHNGTAVSQKTMPLFITPTSIGLFTGSTDLGSGKTKPTSKIGKWQFNDGNTFVNNSNTFTLPSKSGTIALDSDIKDIKDNYETKSDADTKHQQLADSISKMTSFEYSVVSTLPTSGVKGTIYLVPDTHSDKDDIYDEYMWLGDKFEKIGNTDTDLSGYFKLDTSTQDLPIGAGEKKILVMAKDSSGIPTGQIQIGCDGGGFYFFVGNSTTHVTNYSDKVYVRHDDGNRGYVYWPKQVKDGSELATRDQIPTKISQLENDSGYLTSHPISLSAAKAISYADW